MKINQVRVGLHRKVGRPNFGSSGASCEVHLEIPPDQPADQTRRQVREAFAACDRLIEEQLSPARRRDASSSIAGSVDPRGRSNKTLASSGGRSGDQNQRAASPAQIRALHAIASRGGVILASELENVFGVPDPGELSMQQASQMIDHLKALPSAS